MTEYARERNWFDRVGGGAGRTFSTRKLSPQQEFSSLAVQTILLLPDIATWPWSPSSQLSTADEQTEQQQAEEESSSVRDRVVHEVEYVWIPTLDKQSVESWHAPTAAVAYCILRFPEHFSLDQLSLDLEARPALVRLLQKSDADDSSNLARILFRAAQYVALLRSKS